MGKIIKIIFVLLLFLLLSCKVYYELLNLGEETEEHFDFEVYWYSPKGEYGRRRERHRLLEKLVCLPIEVTGSENHER